MDIFDFILIFAIYLGLDVLLGFCNASFLGVRTGEDNLVPAQFEIHQERFQFISDIDTIGKDIGVRFRRRPSWTNASNALLLPLASDVLERLGGLGQPLIDDLTNQFTYKGKQSTDSSSKRQGQRRFAKVVDSESISRGGQPSVRICSGS